MLPSQKFTAAFASAPQAPRTLVEEAYLKLRQDIIELRLQPGEKLRVEHLKDRYGVGAGTLREALSLLLSDALVLAEGQRGFHVAPISMADLEDLTRTRVLLEQDALKSSIRQGDGHWEAALDESYSHLGETERQLGGSGISLRDWEECNRVFHEVLIGADRSRWIRYLLGLSYRQLERYRHLAMSLPNPKRDIAEEHRQIYVAAKARDTRKAARLLENHIWETFESLRRLDATEFERVTMRQNRTTTME